jgi:hypothetical protein
VLLSACVISALAPLLHARAADDEPASRTQWEWPMVLDGRPLLPLALSDVERRFAAQFPGRIGRFRSDADVVTLRVAQRPTRMLHPAADCYRGLGYRVRGAQLEQDDRARLWRCFTAWRTGSTVRVCERIEASDGGVFTDTSAWYWAAALGRSQGPWLAITKARPL